MSERAYHKVKGSKAPAPDGCPVDAEFTPYSDRYVTDPYAWLKEKREHEPIFYSEDLGYVVVTRMDEIREVFMNPDIYSSENVQDPVFPICDEAVQILSADDYNPIAVMSNRQQPGHTRIRKYTQAAFSARRMKLLEPVIRERAGELIGAMLDRRGPVDWVEAVGNPLPAETIFRLLGFPESDDEQVKAWTSNRLEFTWGRTTPEQQVAVATNLLAYWRYVAAYVAMRREDPVDSFTSELLDAHAADPEDLTYDEVVSIVYGLSFAGHEIVRNMISNTLLCLLSERENWERLCRDPSRIKSVIEESLRFNSAQTSWRRITTRETRLGEFSLPAGTPVFLSLAAANRDPGVFSEPDQFNMDRDNASQHIAFGRGIHICLGRLLAKLELRVVLDALIEKAPSLRLEPEQDLDYAPNFSFRGPRTLFVNWD